jgi:hypothetical protein
MAAPRHRWACLVPPSTPCSRYCVQWTECIHCCQVQERIDCKFVEKFGQMCCIFSKLLIYG